MNEEKIQKIAEGHNILLNRRDLYTEKSDKDVLTELAERCVRMLDMAGVHYDMDESGFIHLNK